MVRCYSIRLPRRVASCVNYSSRWTESSSEHFASDLSLLKADALWCENQRCSDSNPWPMDPKACVLPTTPQRLTNVCRVCAWRQNVLFVCKLLSGIIEFSILGVILIQNNLVDECIEVLIQDTWTPYGRGTVVLIVSCRCTYCCLETSHWKVTRHYSQNFTVAFCHEQSVNCLTYILVMT